MYTGSDREKTTTKKINKETNEIKNKVSCCCLITKDVIWMMNLSDFYVVEFCNPLNTKVLSSNDQT